MKLQRFHPTVVTERLIECRDFYRRWFGLEPVFEANWFILLGSEEGTATIAFMRPDHPSAPPGPEPSRARKRAWNFRWTRIDGSVPNPTEISRKRVIRCRWGPASRMTGLSG